MGGRFFSDAVELAAQPSSQPSDSPVTTFSGTDEIDSGVLYGTPTLDDWIYGTWRVPRRIAIRIPAVKRARDLIAGGLGQFPLTLVEEATEKVIPWDLLSQPEAGVPSSVTWTRVADDLLLSERSWLQHAAIGWHNAPVQVVRLDPESVSIQPRTVSYGYGAATVWPEVPGLIRIDSPNDGLLEAGAPAIKALWLLERAALNHVSGVPPLDYFTPADPDFDPDEADVKEILDQWETARAASSTAWVPNVLKYNSAGFNPEELQMAKAREFGITEIARLTGIDAEALSVPVTSRVYFNAQDRRRERIEDVLGPYMSAVEQRLSMDDVTPRGFKVRFDTTNYLRLDDQAAAETDVALVGAQIITRDEARAKRGLEPGTAPALTVPTPAPAAPAREETADAS